MVRWQLQSRPTMDRSMAADHHPKVTFRSEAELRSAAARVLDSAPSARVFDNRLLAPRSDYDLNPELLAELDGAQPRPAAVLVPIIARPEGLTVLLTQRPETMPTHAGQIAFPGGKMDKSDATPVDTALREAEEEVGLHRRHVDVLGFLDSYQTGTSFRIVPVVGLVDPGFCEARRCSGTIVPLNIGECSKRFPQSLRPNTLLTA